MLLLKCWLILPCLQMAVFEKLHYELSNSCLPAKSTKHAWRVCGLLIHVWGQCPRQWWHMDQVLIKRYASQAVSASLPSSIGLLKICIRHCILVSDFVRSSHLQETDVVPSTTAYKWCNRARAQYSCKSQACAFPFWTLQAWLWALLRMTSDCLKGRHTHNALGQWYILWVRAEI